MASSKHRPPRLPAPYLRRIWLDSSKLQPGDQDRYPFNLAFLDDEFDLVFDSAVTIIVGENGCGKSTILEAVAELIGFDQAGGAAGYRPLNHSRAMETSGSELARVLRPSWLPRTNAGWFFRAESFFSVARYLDMAAVDAGGAPPEFLSHSHGEGFLRFFEERCQRRGIYIFDEPESALSPARQILFLKFLMTLTSAAQAQIIMATHSPILMSLPKAQLLFLTPEGLRPTTVEETENFRIMRDFTHDPRRYIEEISRSLSDRQDDE